MTFLVPEKLRRDTKCAFCADSLLSIAILDKHYYEFYELKEYPFVGYAL